MSFEMFYIIGVLLVVAYMIIFEYLTTDRDLKKVQVKTWITDFIVSLFSWIAIPICIWVAIYAYHSRK